MRLKFVQYKVYKMHMPLRYLLAPSMQVVKQVLHCVVNASPQQVLAFTDYLLFHLGILVSLESAIENIVHQVARVRSILSDLRLVADILAPHWV